MFRREKRYLYLNNSETDILLKSLVQFKNALIRDGRYTDCVDELILKVTGAKVKRI